MKKQFYPTIICLFLSITALKSQEIGSAIFNVNSILTTVQSDGTMFYDSTQTHFFIAPNVGGSDKASTIFVGNLWLGGEDSEGELHLVASSYNRAYHPGPLDVNTGQPFEGLDTLFNRVWTINRSDILALKEDFIDGVIDDELSKDIIEWPAFGSPYFGDIFQNQEGAAFYDENSDGLYNPYDGDYPIIGDDLLDIIPDQMSFALFNGNKVEFNPTGQGFPLEIHLTMYAFSCVENEGLNNSVFTRHKIINRSNDVLNDFYYSLFMDTDLGCYSDDYTGVSPENNLVYCYNSDIKDGYGGICEGMDDTFQTEVPVQSTRLLNNNLYSFSTWRNPASSPTPPSVMADPNTLNEFYNYMKATWRDGTPFTNGGNGYNPGSIDTTKFLFAGNPNNQGEWSMYQENLDSSDWRVLANQKLDIYQPGEIIRMDAVHTFNRSEGLDHIKNVDFAIQQSVEIQNAYDQKFQNVCTQNIQCNTSDHCVYPGDVNDNEIVERTDFMLHGIAIAKAQANFESPRQFISKLWTEYSADSRTQSFAHGINMVHSDCNGDGVIDTLEDFITIETNFGLTTPEYISHEELTEPFPYTGQVVLEVPDEVDLNNQTHTVHGEIKVVNLENVHSISFHLEYDPNVLKPFWTDFVTNSSSGLQPAKSRYNFSKKLDEGKELHVMAYYGVGNITLNSMTGLLMRVLDDVISGETTIKLSNILISDYEENFYTMDDVEKTISIKAVNVAAEEMKEDDIYIYPNPSDGVVYFNSTENLTHAMIFDLDGVLIKEVKLSSNQIEFKDKAGLYFIMLYNKDGLAAQKKIVFF